MRSLGMAFFASCVLLVQLAWAAEAPVERRLHLADARASSYLVNDWNKFQENYLPLYLGDDDPVTAWTDGIKGEGIGEWVRVIASPMKGATRVRLAIRNGYQKSKRLFAANARARSVSVKLLPSGKTQRVELADQWDWQEIVLEQPSGPFDSVELRFESVYPGTKYDDLCISDVRLFVTATTPDNPAFEKQRFEKILAWKADRLKAARLFRSEAGKSLPVASQYVVESDERDSDEPTCDKGGDLCLIAGGLKKAEAERAHDPRLAPHAEVIALAQKLVGEGLKRAKPVQVVAQDKRPVPVVHGLCAPTLDSCQDDPCWSALPLPMPGRLAFLNAGQLSTLDVKDSPTITEIEALKPKACHRKGDTVFAWAMRDDAVAAAPLGPLRALYLVTCGLADGREGYYPSHRAQLLVFDQAGRLELSADIARVTTFDWRAGDKGPVLAGGRSIGPEDTRVTVKEAVNVAEQ